MNWIEKASLRQRLAVPLIAFIFSLFIILQGYNYVNTYQVQQTNLIDRIKVLSNGVSVNLQAALLFDDEITASEVLHAFSADKEILQALLLKSDGRLFAEYRKDGLVAKAPNRTLQLEIAKNGYALGEDAIYILIPIFLDNEVIAKIRLIVSKEGLNETRLSAMRVAFSLFGLIIIFSYIFIAKIQQWVITPVVNLNDAMQGIILRGEFGQRPNVATSDELGDLTLSFNKMADKLEERQKQLNFVLDKVEQERDFGKQIITAVQHGLFAINKKNGQILLSNDASKKLFPEKLDDEFSDIFLLDIINAQEEGKLKEIITQCQEVDDLLIQTKQDSTLQVTTRVLPNKEQLLFSIMDVTEVIQNRTQQKLAANVFKNSQDGVLIFDSLGNLTLMNPAFTEMFGYELNDLIRLSMTQLFDGKHFTTSTNLLAESIERFGQWHGEVLEKDKNGVELPLYIKASKIKDDEQNGQNSYIFIFSNLSDAKERDRLYYLAHHDTLTGLPNRSKFYKSANQTIEKNKLTTGQFGLCYLDLDGFKLVNDTYGHDAGDEVLRVVAKRLENAVRKGDLACRLAGDEFVLFIEPVQDKMQLAELSSRVIESIQKPIAYKGITLFVGVSIGVTIAYYNEEKDIDYVLKESDQAMYEAKLSGKGQYIFYEV
ncbi:sensor domain-containing diguanylate cyclase [Aliivibrio finisterrensis]|uniref:Diguanylate cyclase n=1 Tax=Aliivibrio finisterrensis TaxID=511998 RepID=A0A4V1Z944_9GAMM|nr:diguanylate cyclase [Aliivibrio finisterrensis]RYU49589.1 diguanylate cyclase [Aliivibrio finisterrensis]RYU53342.1 diguanylate cyclase [Aliivibrio finisterrensis]RYU55433.1 diguanylate cyclase [Aliivibrio finisterrensis]RYU65849.1 diguanylate cyclase [Aliivibrio finisterrensis]RYU80356.1 diguanylate cyclase [Aliivibrio finisterrensis]